MSPLPFAVAYAALAAVHSAVPLQAHASLPDTLRVFAFDTLAPGVYAARVLPRPDAYAFANSLVVVGDDAALVVDTQQSPTAASALVAWVARVTDRPVRWVVNTHWHGDHVYGNQAWADAWPEARFVAHEATRAAVLDEGRGALADELEELPATIDQRRSWLESGLGPGGTPLSADEREQVEYSLRLREAYLADLRALRLTPPDTTFGDRLSIDLGARRVELMAVGPAHTVGDVMVWLPEERVLAVGDLLEEAVPWIDGAHLPGWADALERARGLEPLVVLPSHGGLQRDGRLLEGEAALFRTVVDEARRATEEGRTPDEVVGRPALEAHRPFLGSLGVEGDDATAFLRRAVEQAMAQLEAAPPPSSPLAPQYR